MAYITEFSIDGLAGRDAPFAQKLNRDVNVFFGPNGSGKTTLLKILHSALDKDTSALRDLAFRSASVTIYSAPWKRHFTLSITKVPEPGPEETAEAVAIAPTLFGDDVSLRLSKQLWTESVRRNIREQLLAWDITPSDVETNKVKWSHQYLPTARLYREIPGLTGKSVGRSEEELDRHYAAIMQRVWRDYTVDVNSSIREIQDRGFRDIIRNLLADVNEADRSEEPFEAHETYQRVSRFLERQQSLEDVLGPEDQFVRRYNEDSRVRASVRVIEAVERKIANAMRPQEKLRDLIQQMFTGNKAVSFGEREIAITVKDRTKIDLPSLSSGEKHLLLICIQALMADSSSLIIDEPELSMHIDWQHKLLSSLQQLNPSMQLIAATHSPEIMADLPDDKIFRI
ncbi:MAG: ATP-binding protein [Acidobacteriia bacterium]|nr:ATP-binding protein [Terriglobia bacterium]